ncbi:hypothetical protein J9317_18085 [Metabacillus sp. KIGAM252]|uniref:Lipoprotein YvcA n=1 Tax=Metabacillus flavus TaxID=2823519 RepID=A0ABS5LIW4_9BACI|nr:hypothetical protein [Metabacillus flavus]MBS2970657.1 hypothetical protein [Metabacillus flavus]
MSESNPEKKAVQGEGTSSETPKVAAAVQDEFTKSYLTSTKEKEKGFFEFKSKTGGYSMLFPAEAVLSNEFGNERKGNDMEAVMFTGTLEKADMITQSIYENLPITKDIEANLDLLSTSVSYDGKYEEVNKEDRSIYYGKKTTDLDDAIAYNYFSFIKAKDGNQGVRFMYSATCKKSDKSCVSNLEKHEQIANKIIESVTFK